MKKIMITLCTLLALNAGFTMYALPEASEPGKIEKTEPEKGTKGETGRQSVSKDVQENAAKQSKNSSKESKGGKENKSADANGKTKKQSDLQNGSFDLNSSKDASTKSGEKSYTTKLDRNGNVKDPDFVKSVADAFNLDPQDGDSVTSFTSGEKTYFTLKRKDGTSYSVTVDDGGQVLETTKKSLTRSYDKYAGRFGNSLFKEYDATYDPANYDRDGNTTAEYKEAEKKRDDEIQAQRDLKKVQGEIKTSDVQEKNGLNSEKDSTEVEATRDQSSQETPQETAKRLEKNTTQIKPLVEETLQKSATDAQKATVVEWLTSELSKGIESFTQAIADFLQDPMGTISRLTSNPVVVTSPETRANQKPTGSADENYGDESLSASVSQSSQDNLFPKTSTGSLKAEDIQRPSTPIQSTSGALKPIGNYAMPKK